MRPYDSRTRADMLHPLIALSQGGPLGNVIRNARGIITVSLSPFEQRAFAGFTSTVCTRQHSMLPYAHVLCSQSRTPFAASASSLFRLLPDSAVATSSTRYAY